MKEKKLSRRGGVTRSTIKEGEGGISVEYTLIQEITTHRVPVYALSWKFQNIPIS